MVKVYVIAACALFGLSRLAGYFRDPLLSLTMIHAITGEPSMIPAPSVQPDELKVVTWNIEGGIAFDRILGTLRQLDADILLLQEVDRFCRRTGGRDVARDLAKLLRMNWLSAGEFQEIGEARDRIPALTGQAVLSKYPIADPRVMRFMAQAPFRWRFNPVQPRRGGRMALRVRTGGVLIYNTHIESGGNDNLCRRQLGEIVADQSRRAAFETPVIVAGDFNNVPAIRSSMFGGLTAADFEDAVGGEQVPTSLGQGHPIDWIFVKNLTPLRGRIVSAPAASDHSPLFAMLDR